MELTKDEMQWALQSLKGKNFKEFTPEERAFMILSNHPTYRAHKEIQEEIKEAANEAKKET